MSVTPWASKVAAVVIMMKSAMIFEIPIPTSVSTCMRASWWGTSINGSAFGSSFSSSTSSAARQSNEPGTDDIGELRPSQAA